MKSWNESNVWAVVGLMAFIVLVSNVAGCTVYQIQQCQETRREIVRTMSEPQRGMVLLQGSKECNQ